MFMMTSRIVSLIAWRQLGFQVHCGSATCILRAVNICEKVTLRPNNLYHFVSVAEIAVVITFHLSETRKSGKCGQVCAYYLSNHSLYNSRKFNHSQDRFWSNTAEKHLRSLIGACTCMREYMISAVSMWKNVAEICVC